MLKLRSFYQGKKIFLTGHTGFKGAWLALWLKEMGAAVTGFALPPEDVRGNLFNLIDLQKHIHSIERDIRDRETLAKAINDCRPDMIFHLAAQPLVLRSYNDPVKTYETNVMGTVNVLEAARQMPSVKSIIVITTDKCYENKEWLWAYRENDRLGGYDPYSSSKAMTELAAQSYYQSFFKDKNIGVATARAGNVIGGGDFAEYRIIPDIVEAISKNEPVVLRNPHAIRPWQHVFDALYGYMLIGKKLYENPEKYSTAFNFAPDDNSNDYTVEHITQTFINQMGQGSYQAKQKEKQLHEAHYLRLDASKAKFELGWAPFFSTQTAITETAKWYAAYLKKSDDLYTLTKQKINNYGVDHE